MNDPICAGRTVLREEPPLQLFRGQVDIRHNKDGIDCKGIMSIFHSFWRRASSVYFGCRHKGKNVYFPMEVRREGRFLGG